ENRKKAAKTQDIVPEAANQYEQYIPDLFRLPFGGVNAGDTIQLKCQYLQTLEYFKKGYGLLVPLYFPEGTMVENANWEERVKVRCKINALSTETKIHVFSHEVSQKQLDDGSIYLETTKCKSVQKKEEQMNHPMYSSEDFFLLTKNCSYLFLYTYIYILLKKKNGRDFELTYNVKNDSVTVNAIRKDETDSENQNSNSMCVFITPPASLSSTFGRALDRLRTSDKFAVCAFDHRQFYFQQTLVTATEDRIKAAKSWIEQHGPERGGTVMDAPIRTALDVLDSCDLLPFIVLITDGASERKQICQEIEKRESRELDF
ncbi:hypothetical protein RFI_09002, partial [Reticulomyxa filosa]